MSDDRIILGIPAIAAALGHSFQTTRRLADEGLLPTTKLGARITTTPRLLREWREGVEAHARAAQKARQIPAA